MQIDIIGSGRMAHAIGTRARAGGHTLTFLARNTAQARQLATELDATAGSIAPDALTGEIVVLALPYRAALEVAADLAPALAGRVVVDVTNPIGPSREGLATAADTSAAEELATILSGQAAVVKAFNTAFASTLVSGEVGGQPLDIFVAGDDPLAVARVVRLVSDGGMHAVNCGPLARARQLEQLALLGILLQPTLGTAFNTGWKLQLPA